MLNRNQLNKHNTTTDEKIESDSRPGNIGNEKAMG